MTAEIKVLGCSDEKVLASIAPGVFDCDVKEHWLSEFLGDPRHHLAVAIDAGLVVGFASAVHYVNPDKPPELWINEIGVAPTHRNQGLGKKLLRALFAVGRQFGCSEAWVLTDRSNPPRCGCMHQSAAPRFRRIRSGSRSVLTKGICLEASEKL
jgi:aminoglycoside 6'-N-acetyltransferase I